MRLEEQLRNLGLAIEAEQLPVSIDEVAPLELSDVTGRSTRPRRRVQQVPQRRRALVGGLAAASIAMLVVGLAVLLPNNRDVEPNGPGTTLASSDSTSSTTTSSVPSPGSVAIGDVPSVEPRADVEWPLATELPAGIELRYALDAGPGDRLLVFGEGDCRFQCDDEIRVSLAQIERAPGEGTDLVADGTVWTVDGYPGVYRDLGDELFAVEAERWSVEDLTVVAASIERTSEVDLGRPPLVWPGSAEGPEARVVAEATIDSANDGEPWQLRAHTDGELIALGPLAIDDTPGPFYAVTEDDPFMLGYRPGRFMSPSAPSGVSFIYGVTHPDVSRLEFDLPDGSTTSVLTADGGGGFSTRFVMATVPDPDSSLSSVEVPWVTVTAYDAQDQVVAVEEGDPRRIEPPETTSADRPGEFLSPLREVRPRLTNQADTEMFVVDASVASYWRLATLARFDGSEWGFPESALASLDGQLPDEGAVGEELRQEIRIVGLDGFLVPAAGNAIAASSAADDLRWNDDSSTLVKVDSELADGDTFEIVSALPRFDAERLEAATSTTAGDPIYTQLPDNFPASIRQVAGEFTDETTTPYEVALTLQAWFREEFVYSLEVQSGHGNIEMEAFLTNRVGYSEQFAGTYAAMLRSVGIPTRVAVGFTSGVGATDQGFSVRGSDAHAWPEVWFDELGWVPFEPTPGRGAPGAENHTGVAAP